MFILIHICKKQKIYLTSLWKFQIIENYIVNAQPIIRYFQLLRRVEYLSIYAIMSFLLHKIMKFWYTCNSLSLSTYSLRHRFVSITQHVRLFIDVLKAVVYSKNLMSTSPDLLRLFTVVKMINHLLKSKVKINLQFYSHSKLMLCPL